ncbi:MAG: hypothetical protein SGJ04_01805 [Bacteroidota bacterium]|nr:hypothetical protein [Bacteroidota bacterium]
MKLILAIAALIVVIQTSDAYNAKGNAKKTEEKSEIINVTDLDAILLKDLSAANQYLYKRGWKYFEDYNEVSDGKPAEMRKLAISAYGEIDKITTENVFDKNKANAWLYIIQVKELGRVIKCFFRSENDLVGLTRSATEFGYEDRGMVKGNDGQVNLYYTKLRTLTVRKIIKKEGNLWEVSFLKN